MSQPESAGTSRGLWDALTALYLTCGLLSVGMALANQSARHHALYLLVCFCAVATLRWVTLWRRPTPVHPWHLLAASLAVFALGDTYLLLAHHLGESPIRGGSVMDLAWLTAPVLLVAGLIAMLCAQGSGVDRLALLDSITAALVVALMVWVYATSPAAASVQVPSLSQVLSVTYPALSVAAVVLALRLASSGPGRRTWSASLLVVGTVGNLLGTMLWSRHLLDGQDPPALMLLSWLVAYVSLAAAALHPSVTALTASRKQASASRPLPLLATSSALAPTVLVVESLRGRSQVLPVAAVVACAVFLLVLTRVSMMGAMLRELGEALVAERTEQRFRSLVEAASDLILIVKEGRIVYATPSVSHRLGRSGEDLTGTSVTDIMSEQDARVLLSLPEATDLPGGAATAEHGLADAPRHDIPFQGAAVECRLRDADGRAVTVEVLRSQLAQESGGVVLTMRDVGERRRLENQLRRLAYSDPLTGTANRLQLHDRLAAVLDPRHGEGALLMIDLDDFKIVNDLYGHGVGDDLLLETVRRLQLTADEFDDALIARLGGDEFALMLPEVDFEEARWVCASLLNRLRQPVAVGGAEVEVGASIGLVMLNADRHDVRELLRDADLAMYAAKAAGKNAWMQFEPSMHEELVRRLTLEAELVRALEHGEFELYYQPLVRLGSRRITGVEALVRWRHPERGLVQPDQFIPVVERGALIHRLGAWVLHTACQQAARWSRELGADAPHEVGVNVSPRQLLDPGFADVVAGALAATGLDPTRLVLEVTESTVMDPGVNRDQLAALQRLGVRLSIDDFGTGHSSLSRLGHLPVHTLKIDRTFVAAIPPTGEAPLLRAMVAMAHSLGLSVVAEGIETERQRHYLAGLGCEHGQGFLFSRPVPPEDLHRLLTDPGPTGDRGFPTAAGWLPSQGRAVPGTTQRALRTACDGEAPGDSPSDKARSQLA